MDGNLSSDDFLLVDAWLKEHPEDAEVLNDWDALSLNFNFQSAPKVEAEVQEGLDWNALMIGGVEGSLNLEEQNTLHSAVNSNAGLKKELDLYRLTKLEADQTIVFPRKAELLKTLSIFSGEVITLRRIAVAAIFIGVVSGYLMLSNSEQQLRGEYLARTEEPLRITAQAKIESKTETDIEKLGLDMKEKASTQIASLAGGNERTQAIERNAQKQKDIKREKLQWKLIQERQPKISILNAESSNDFIAQASSYSYTSHFESSESPEPGFVANALKAVKARITGEREKLLPSTNELKDIAKSGLQNSKRIKVDFEEGKLVALGTSKLYWENK